MTRIDHIKRPLLFFIACMALFAALIWLNTSSPETNFFSSGSPVEGGGPGSAYPPDVVGIPDSMRARVLRRLRPK